MSSSKSSFDAEIVSRKATMVPHSMYLKIEARPLPVLPVGQASEVNLRWLSLDYLRLFFDN